MLKNLLNNISNKLEQQKQELNNYNNLVDTTTTFQKLFPIQKTEKEPNIFKINIIQNNCPDINKEKAILIDGIIPITETYLNVYYSKEILTNIEYYLIPTNKYLWVINQNNYGAFNYNTINAKIIKNNLMSKVILLNNILLEVTGNENILQLIDIINNEEKRNNLILEKTSYLCGITPTKQLINAIGNGISINNNSIVFHKKNENYLTNANELINYELLIDNQAIYSKNSSSSNKMTSFTSSCYTISIKITTKDKELLIPILEQNTFGTKYNNHDTIYQENFNFAKKIIDEIKKIQG